MKAIFNNEHEIVTSIAQIDDISAAKSCTCTSLRGTKQSHCRLVHTSAREIASTCEKQRLAMTNSPT